jgi:hypothetical protein
VYGWLGRLLLAASAAASVGLALGCGDQAPPDASVNDVTPNIVGESKETTLTIRGSNFLGVARLALDTRDPVTVDDQWRVRIGDHNTLSSDAVHVLDRTTLQAHLPSQLPLGDHALIVMGPAGQEVILEPGLSVVADDDPRLGDPDNPTVPETCDASCLEPGGPPACCSALCPLGVCPTCEAGGRCTLECESAGTCTASCQPGSTCSLSSTNTGGAFVGCDSASCDVECTNNTSCSLQCTGSSSCALHCGQGGPCNLDCRDGSSCLVACEPSVSACDVVCDNPVDCGDGVFVCNRACP